MAVPGSLVLPNLISCEPKDTTTGGLQGKVAIVGAGAAGMYAAHLLQNEGIEVEVIEAAQTHGGRIRYLEGFSDFPLELGADEIHGNDNVWHSLVQSAGLNIRERILQKYYVLEGTIGLEQDFETDVDFLIAQGFIRELPNYQGPDVTIQSAINTGGIKQRVHHILNAEIEKYDGSALAVECPSCGYRTLRVEEEKVLRSPTMDEEGEIEEYYACSYCGHKERRTVNTKKLHARPV